MRVKAHRRQFARKISVIGFLLQQWTSQSGFPMRHIVNECRNQKTRSINEVNHRQHVGKFNNISSACHSGSEFDPPTRRGTFESTKSPLSSTMTDFSSALECSLLILVYRTRKKNTTEITFSTYLRVRSHCAPSWASSCPTQSSQRNAPPS